MCKNEKRPTIDDQLVRRVPLRRIAKQSDTSVAALHRHRQHLPATLTKARQAKEVARASTLLERIEDLIRDCERIAKAAERAKDWRAAIAAHREIRGNLELLGKLAGQLAGGTTVAVNVNVPEHEFVTQNDEEAELVARTLLERLQQHRLRPLAEDEPEEGLRITWPSSRIPSTS